MNKVFSISLSVLCCAAPSCGLAGAWPRGTGNIFVAASAEMTWPKGRAIELPDIYGGTYLEYGLNARVTLGLDVGSTDITRPDRLKTITFARYTITPSNQLSQIAFDFGAGTFLGEPVVRLGVSYGKGFTFSGRQSWVAVDAHSLQAINTQQFATSIDATFGVSMKRGKLMGQVSAFQAFDRTQNASFTPSFAYDIGHGRHLEIGARIGLTGKPDPALKIGIWQEF